MHRLCLVIFLLSILSAAGCGDGSLAPERIVGHYELESVNGRPLPFSSGPCAGCVGIQILHSDLVMRADRTFSLGFVIYETGTFRLDGTQLRMTIPPYEPGAGSQEMTGVAAADSIAVGWGTNPEYQLVFRRAPRDRQALTRSTYTLGAVNGQSTLVISETVTSTGRHTTRVVFDTLVFLDNVFYRRHRAEESVLHQTGGGDVVTSASSYERHGSHYAVGDKVILRPYYDFGDARNDTLSIEGTSLVRRTALISSMTLVERYDRR